MATPLHNIPFTPKAPSAVGHAVALAAASYDPPLSVIYTGAGGDIIVTLSGDDTAVTLKATVARTFITGLSIKTVGTSPPADSVGFW